MKKTLKVLTILLFIMMFVSTTLTVFGYDKSLIDGGDTTNNTQFNNLERSAKSITSTIIFIFQILSVAGIIITGIRYMYGGASKKAEMKKGLITIMIGCIIVFGGATAIGFITNSFGELVTP